MAELTTAASTAPIPILALDRPSLAAALALVDQLGDRCRFYKVGLELYTAEGPRAVQALRERGAEVFLDLKLHDIPNTVAGAVRRAAATGVRLLTVHTSGGPVMLRAAADAAADVGAGAAGGECQLLGVTVLTSMDAAAVAAVWGRPVPDVAAEVLRLAGLAADAGLHGVVCSGMEAAAVRDRYGAALTTLVPGVRLSGAGVDDQARTVTPGGAARAGARYVVLGRAVTAAADPVAPFEAIRREIASAVQ